MPTASQHRGKAEKNLRFLARISLTDDPEWAVTVAFYVAVHRVEQLRAAAGDSQNHADRIDYVRVRLGAIFDPFLRLYHASRVARYDSAADFFRDFPTPADVQTRVLDTWLAAIEAHTAPPPASPPQVTP